MYQANMTVSRNDLTTAAICLDDDLKHFNVKGMAMRDLILCNAKCSHPTGS